MTISEEDILVTDNDEEKTTVFNIAEETTSPSLIESENQEISKESDTGLERTDAVKTSNSLETVTEITVDEEAEVSVTEGITENEKIDETATEAETELSSEVTESNALLGEQVSNISTTETVSDGTQTESYSEIKSTESTNQAEPVTEQADNELLIQENWKSQQNLIQEQQDLV